MNKTQFILLTSIFLTMACQHIESRRARNSTDSFAETNDASRESANKHKIRELEKRLITKQEKQQYSKLLPWFLNDEERVSYLSTNSFEQKQDWVQKSGILTRQSSLAQKYRRIIENQDIALGMPSDLVKKSWGDPLQVEVSGNPIFKNEKWRYLRSVSSNEGFRQEKRIVYFESGKVVGWETE